MINHARTLLMNWPGPHKEQLQIPGDVYIPVYSPLDYGQELSRTAQVLFGPEPDYEGRIYRVAQYMTLLHNTEYEPYLLSLDPRITYDTETSGLETEAAYGAAVTSDSSVQMTVAGTWAGDATLGRALTKWVVIALSASQIRVQNVTVDIEATYDVDQGKKTLPGSTLVIGFSKDVLVPGDRWDVVHRARIAPDIGVVTANIEALSPQTLAVLFAGSSDVNRLNAGAIVEPYLTFYRLFTENYAQPYRLIGALLTFIYRTEELRTHAN